MSLRSFPGMVVAITIGLLFFPVVAAAQSVRYVDIDAAGANDGTTWQDAYNDLGDALADAAGAAGAVTQIWVANGTYSPAGFVRRPFSSSTTWRSSADSPAARAPWKIETSPST